MLARGAKFKLRIIGGTWRGRRLAFPDQKELRPTPDRVRETLFNWLSPIISGARCLDLYAGSGALGLEALSRGAMSAVFVERDFKTIACLQQNVKLLQIDADVAQIAQSDVPNWLQHADSAPDPFDIVFLDPPFGQAILDPCCERLERQGWLKPNARIYLESERDYTPQLPDNWTVTRAKTAGQVAYRLAIRESSL